MKKQSVQPATAFAGFFLVVNLFSPLARAEERVKFDQEDALIASEGAAVSAIGNDAILLPSANARRVAAAEIDAKTGKVAQLEAGLAELKKDVDRSKSVVFVPRGDGWNDRRVFLNGPETADAEYRYGLGKVIANKETQGFEARLTKLHWRKGLATGGMVLGGAAVAAGTAVTFYEALKYLNGGSGMENMDSVVAGHDTYRLKREPGVLKTPAAESRPGSAMAQ
jgi:hypothetical protein